MITRNKSILFIAFLVVALPVTYYIFVNLDRDAKNIISQDTESPLIDSSYTNETIASSYTNETIASNSESCLESDSDTLSLVDISASLDQASPSIFHFSVRNNYSSPLVAFNLGEDSNFHIYNLPSREPSSFMSPESWKGFSSPVHEQPYIRIGWVSSTGINQYSSLSGFQLVMKDDFQSLENKYKNNVGMDGAEIETLGFTNLPFRADFLDGSCFWGNVSTSP